MHWIPLGTCIPQILVTEFLDTTVNGQYSICMHIVFYTQTENNTKPNKSSHQSETAGEYGLDLDAGFF